MPNVDRPPIVNKGVSMFRKMDEPEQAEHKEVASWAIRKAMEAHRNGRRWVVAFTLDRNQTVIQALCYGRFPIKEMRASPTQRVIAIKVFKKTDNEKDVSIT